MDKRKLLRAAKILKDAGCVRKSTFLALRRMERLVRIPMWIWA